MDRFDLLLEDLDKTDKELEMDWNPQVLYERLNTLVQLRNFRVIDAQSHLAGNQFIGVVKGMAKGKYTGKAVAVVVFVQGTSDGNQCHVTVEALAEDEAMLAVTVRELVDELRPLTEMIPAIKKNTEALLDRMNDLSEEQAQLVRKTIESVNQAVLAVDSSRELQQEHFEKLSADLERALEALDTPKSAIERMKDALNGGMKEGIVEVGKIALRQLVRIVVGV